MNYTRKRRHIAAHTIPVNERSWWCAITMALALALGDLARHPSPSHPYVA